MKGAASGKPRRSERYSHNKQVQNQWGAGLIDLNPINFKIVRKRTLPAYSVIPLAKNNSREPVTDQNALTAHGEYLHEAWC